MPLGRKHVGKVVSLGVKNSSKVTGLGHKDVGGAFGAMMKAPGMSPSVAVVSGAFAQAERSQARGEPPSQRRRLQ